MASAYDESLALLNEELEESRQDTNRRFHADRNANTVAAYKAKKKEWVTYCDRAFGQLPVTLRYTMTEAKLHHWIKEDILPRKKKNTRGGEEDDDGCSLSYQTVYAFVAGGVNIWREQVEEGINSNPHPAPRNGSVKKLLALRSQVEAQRRRIEFLDRGKGTALEAFSAQDLLNCNSHCLASGESLALRSRVMLNLSFALLLRGQSARIAELADFFPILLPREATQPVTAVCMVIDIDKTNNTGVKHVMGAMRHLDYRACTQNAMAMYFFNRWHVSGESFPEFDEPRNWYPIKLLLPNSARGDEHRTTALSYNQHRAVIGKLFLACNVSSAAKTHATRHSGAQHAELHGVPELQIRRAGRWNSSVMEGTYLSHLPRKFMRVAAGSPPDDNAYFCRRSLVQPPQALVDQVFPRVDHWLDPARESRLPDTASAGFLRMLDYLRRILIQDMVFVRRDFPSHPLLAEAPFSSPEFGAFAEELLAVAEVAPDPITTQLQQIAPAVVARLDELAVTGQQREAAAIQRWTEFWERWTGQGQQQLSRFDRLEAMIAQQSAANAQLVALAAEEFQRMGSRLLARVNPGLADDADAISGSPDTEPQVPGLSVAGVAGVMATSSLLTPTTAVAGGPAAQWPAPTPALAPVPAPSTPSSEATFRMDRNISTVAAAWREWTVGINGGASVTLMESQFGNGWRRGEADRKFFSRRKVLIEAIEDLMETHGLTAPEAVIRMEQRRAGRSLSQLLKELMANRNRPTGEDGQGEG